jgi:LmbE family N-acetylglucosaminyl deacetylase
MNRVIRELDENDLGRNAIVFSPHPDDETLGCGGTIIKKKRTGAEVKIFFMTDGRKSHPHLISENKLKFIRAREALAASRILGLEENDVAFLEYEDGELSKNRDLAIHKVREILLLQQPDEIFIPYHKEPSMWSEDHLATNRIVLSALQMCKRNAIIYEYPTWFWYYQPWVSLPMGTPKEILSALKQSLVSGLSLLKDFRCSVYIEDVLELKQTALNQHKSQMTRLVSDSRWQTLGDISNGEFLECFFQQHEIFHQKIFMDKTLKSVRV